MTERVAALSVILEENVREDDVKSLMDAIALIRGVIKVEPVYAGYQVGDSVSEARACRELGTKIAAVL